MVSPDKFNILQMCYAPPTRLQTQQYTLNVEVDSAQNLTIELERQGWLV
jgi:hypothetical protein